MEGNRLESPEYWETPGIDVRLNPRLELDATGLLAVVAGELGLESAVVFATSGTGGSGRKFVVLDRSAILASARAVNSHLEVDRNDRWLCALTTFHVGGLGVWARAWLSGSAVSGMEGDSWDQTGGAFSSACRDRGITLTALTPTHLHDVVAGKHRAPESLRALLIGGAALSRDLLARAVDLGWPVLRTYGMTEAASQVATDPLSLAHQSDRPGGLPVLSHWETRCNPEGVLEIRGDSLFHAYARRNVGTGEWVIERPFDGDGFYETGDRVKLAGQKPSSLEFVGRTDELVKKLGEKIALENLRSILVKKLCSEKATIVALPDSRLGSRLVAVVEPEASSNLARDLAAYQGAVAPFERLDGALAIESLPRTEIGKIAHGNLRDLVESGALDPIPLDS